MIEPNHFSYKDFSARVVKKKGIYLRYIFKTYKSEYDFLMSSGLYQELLRNNLIISHEEVSLDEFDENVYKLLLPHQITFQSYPFEWSFCQWKKVIFSFIQINQIALKYGMVLKDATPFNFYFEGSNAVMFDTSSFIFLEDNNYWFAYRQFCQELLSPLTLMYYNGPIWGKFISSCLRGFPLDFVSKQLPLKSWFNLSVFLHIHLHSKYSSTSSNDERSNKQGGFSLEKMNFLMSMIKSSINSWDEPVNYRDYWNKYYSEDIEFEEYLDSKELVVKRWLKLLKPKSVLDLGANTGRFSFIASSFVDEVISLESDHTCVDEIVRQIDLKKIKNVTPLVNDLSELSPSIGFMNEEFSSLFKRANSEVVFALALIHHLYFSKDLAFNQISELFSKLSVKYLIIEFIPNSDRKVKGLSKFKSNKIDGYNLSDMMFHFSSFFQHMETANLTCSERVLILYSKK